MFILYVLATVKLSGIIGQSRIRNCIVQMKLSFIGTIQMIRDNIVLSQKEKPKFKNIK